MKLAALFVVCFMLMSRAVFAQANGDPCQSYPNVDINIVPLFDPETYDYSKSIEALQTLANDNRHSIRESLALGLTRYVPILEVKAPILGVRLPNGLVCAHVERVNVTVGYRNVMVFIASDIAQNTCGFNEVMAHEQKHIRVNHEVLDEYVPIIQERLKEYLRDNGVIREENPDYALSILNQKLQEIVNQLVEQMFQENMGLQRQVDSIEEYRRISNSCNGELANLTSRYLHQRN